MNEISYRIKRASEHDILSHLNDCSDSFVPTLKSYVNIPQYSQKIFLNAITFEAWKEGVLIGLLAVYYKDAIGFITNVSVLKTNTRLGVAKNLLNLCLDYGKLIQIQQVDLEVFKENIKAKEFYKSFGFRKIKEIDELEILSLIY